MCNTITRQLLLIDYTNNWLHNKKNCYFYFHVSDTIIRQCNGIWLWTIMKWNSFCCYIGPCMVVLVGADCCYTWPWWFWWVLTAATSGPGGSGGCWLLLHLALVVLVGADCCYIWPWWFWWVLTAATSSPGGSGGCWLLLHLALVVLVGADCCYTWP